mmetsp:Transcript_11862/g.23377  ORF Transcript_11862/g.23377 Transcript_11862/m.23377 type:complete len:216 (+) Transcript_11862:325-972(+)
MRWGSMSSASLQSPTFSTLTRSSSSSPPSRTAAAPAASSWSGAASRSLRALSTIQSQTCSSAPESSSTAGGLCLSTRTSSRSSTWRVTTMSTHTPTCHPSCARSRRQTQLQQRRSSGSATRLGEALWAQMPSRSAWCGRGLASMTKRHTRWHEASRTTAQSTTSASLPRRTATSSPPRRSLRARRRLRAAGIHCVPCCISGGPVGCGASRGRWRT